MRASARCAYGERKTRAVCQRHELRAFAWSFPLTLPVFHPHEGAVHKALREVEPATLFQILGSAEEPRRALLPRSSAGSGGGRSGRADNAPAGRAKVHWVRRTHRIPLSTSLGSRQDRPLPSARRGGSGSGGSRISRCSSIRSTSALRFR